MKKSFWFHSVMILLVLVLSGCKPVNIGPDITDSTPPETQESQQTTQAQKQEDQSAETVDGQETATSGENEPAVVTPLAAAVDITKLEDCTVAISLEKGDFYVDKTGAVMMDVTVFAYDVFDLVDISSMKEGDTILRGQEEVLILSIERNENGLVLINGGLDDGGFELYTEENTVYYERSDSDGKVYYEIGKVSLPVSSDFTYSDASDLDKGTVTLGAEDFLEDAANIEYCFNANNTTIEIENGYVTAMTKV